jgi:hypothetical protein
VTKESTDEEYKTILNMYICYNRTSKYVKKKLAELKEIEKLTL